MVAAWLQHPDDKMVARAHLMLRVRDNAWEYFTNGTRKSGVCAVTISVHGALRCTALPVHTSQIISNHLNLISSHLISSHLKSNQIKSNQIKSSQVKSNQIKSNHITLKSSHFISCHVIPQEVHSRSVKNHEHSVEMEPPVSALHTSLDMASASFESASMFGF